MRGGGNSDAIDVVFSVLVETAPGSEVRVVGSADALGRWHLEGGVTLRSEPDLYPLWSVAVRLQTGCAGIEYKFVKVLPDGSVEWEEGPNRWLPPGVTKPGGACTPRFGQRSISRASSAASMEKGGMSPHAASPVRNGGGRDVVLDCGSRGDSLSIGNPAPGIKAADSVEVKFEATCTSTAPGDVLRVVGSADAIGRWSPARGLELTTSASTFPRWNGSARLRCGDLPVEWKLVISRSDGTADWESGPNRCTNLIPNESVSVWLVQVLFEGSCCAPEPCKVSKPGSAPAPATIADASCGQAHATSSTSAASAASMAPATRPTLLQVASPVATEELQKYKGKRSTSLSFFVDPSNFRSNDAESFTPSRGVAPETRSKKDLESALPDHMLVLRLSGASSEVAAAIVVEVCFPGPDSKIHRLQLDKVEADEARWALSVAELGLPVGIHFFSFFVGGEQILSCDHAICGETNAILVSEPIRRYILIRESGPSQTVQDDVDVLSQDRAGPMARSWSCAFNIAPMDEDEGDMLDTSQSAIPNFNKDVFDGLYDAELRLRIDSHVLPQSGMASSGKQKLLHLWAGGHLLKKKVGACEDAYFTEDDALGVADGVGCMVQFASYGINAAAYAAELMEHSRNSLRPGGVAAPGVTGSVEDRAASALAAAEQTAENYGASTITLLVLEGTQVGVANLGDSGFMLLRKAQHGMTVVKRSEEQQHSWNCPYQLTRLPKALAARLPKVSLDTAEDCERYCFEVQEGDLLLMFTDGLRDNLHEREILHIVDCALPPAFGELVGLAEHATPPENVARALALAAQERSLDPVAKVPFNEYSKRHGYQCTGGKQDDITVVAAWVMPEPRSVSQCPMPAATPVSIESVSLGGGAARLHKGHAGTSKLKYEMPRRSSGYEQTSPAGGITSSTPGSPAARPPQGRAAFRPMSSTRSLGAGKSKKGSGTGRRSDT